MKKRWWLIMKNRTSWKIRCDNFLSIFVILKRVKKWSYESVLSFWLKLCSIDISNHQILKRQTNDARVLLIETIQIVAELAKYASIKFNWEINEEAVTIIFCRFYTQKSSKRWTSIKLALQMRNYSNRKRYRNSFAGETTLHLEFR